MFLFKADTIMSTNYLPVVLPLVWLRKPAIAGNKGVGQHCYQPFTLAVDYAAAYYPCGVASKPHTHGLNDFARLYPPLDNNRAAGFYRYLFDY